MDLNKATLPELQTLKGIGESRAEAILKKRGELNTALTREALASLEVDVPHSVINNLITTGAILDIPFEKDGGQGPTGRGECEQTTEAAHNSQLEALLKGIQSSINGLARSAQQVDARMDEMEERFAANEASMLTLMALPKPEMRGSTTEVKHGIVLNNSEGNIRQNIAQQQPSKAMGGGIFKAKMPVFDGKGRWQSYLLQFQTILHMYQCCDERVMVGKLVEALREKALDYFESLPVAVRTDFAALCKAMESRFGRTEHGPIVRAKLQASSQLISESLDEFADRIQRMATEGYSGMEGRWVQLMAVDVLLKGCVDKRSALQAMEKEPATIQEAVQLLKRTSNYEQVLGLGQKSIRQVSQVEQQIEPPLPTEGSHEIRKVSIPVNSAGGTSGEILQALEKMSGQLSTLLERSTTTNQVPRRPALRCYACNQLGHLARNCSQRVSGNDSRTNAQTNIKDVKKNE